MDKTKTIIEAITSSLEKGQNSTETLVSVKYALLTGEVRPLILFSGLESKVESVSAEGENLDSDELFLESIISNSRAKNWKKDNPKIATFVVRIPERLHLLVTKFSGSKSINSFVLEAIAEKIAKDIKDSK